MSFQPVLPLGGYAGWRFLARTAESQRESLAQTPALQRDTAAFRERIAKVTSAEALVADRALLKVALGAFGLGDDLGNRAFVRRILESAPGDSRALANRLADKRYQEFSRAFGFADPAGPHTARAGFADRIVRAYETRQFEVAVGQQDETMRLALGAVRELDDLARRGSSPDTLWLTVMGQPPLRRVFETAFGLPKGFGSLDLDRQIAVLRDKAARTLGNGEVTQFTDPAQREALVRQFLMRSEVQASTAAVRGSTALALLQSAPRIPR